VSVERIARSPERGRDGVAVDEACVYVTVDEPGAVIRFPK
jgi:hypothetical protein